MWKNLTTFYAALFDFFESKQIKWVGHNSAVVNIKGRWIWVDTGDDLIASSEGNKHRKFHFIAILQYVRMNFFEQFFGMLDLVL